MTDPKCPTVILGEAVGRPADPNHECPLCEMGVPIRAAEPLGLNCRTIDLRGMTPEQARAVMAQERDGVGFIMDTEMSFADLEDRVFAQLTTSGRVSAYELRTSNRPKVERFVISKPGLDPKGREWVDANRAPSRPSKRRARHSDGDSR